MKIEYFVDTGLYSNIIFVMLRTSEVLEFILAIDGSVFFEFNAIDGSDVIISQGLTGNFDVCIELREAVKFELIKKCVSLLKQNGPCHDYIDVNEVYSVMVSKDEYF